jgi:hypothetical protein
MFEEEQLDGAAEAGSTSNSDAREKRACTVALPECIHGGRSASPNKNRKDISGSMKGTTA